MSLPTMFVNPARAGMIRAGGFVDHPRRRKPRASGDDPDGGHDPWNPAL